MKRLLRYNIGLLFLIVPVIFAQDAGLEELSIEELLDVEVVSAAQVAARISESPSVTRVIS